MSKVELTKKWWITSRPKEIKGVELERALTTLEQAKDTARLSALGSIPGAIAKVSRELDKKTHKDLLKALETLETLSEAEKKKADAELKLLEKAKAEAEKQKKEMEDNDEDADEKQTPDDKLFDPAFQIGTLKRAIRAPLVFAFAIGSKPEDSILAVHVRGNPKALLRMAKTRSGLVKGCCGQAQASEEDPKTLALSLDGPPVSGLARMMRKYFQVNKITVFRKFRVLVDGQEIESDTSEDETVTDVPAAQPSRPAVASTPEQPSAPPTAKELEVLEDRRREFKRARAAWVAIKTKAEMDLEKVKDGARMLYLADAQQFPKIAQGCKDIDSILDNLDNELRDTLDQYASTSLKNQGKLHALAQTASTILDRYLGYVQSNPVLKAIDHKEFADVVIHAPILKALNDLRRTLL